MSGRRKAILLAGFVSVAAVAAVVVAVVLLTSSGGSTSGDSSTGPIFLGSSLGDLVPKLQQRVQQGVDKGITSSDDVHLFMNNVGRRSGTVQRAGAVLQASDSSLTFEAYPNGEMLTMGISSSTHLERDNDNIRGTDLKQHELVLVTSEDGKTAIAIQALGVTAP